MRIYHLQSAKHALSNIKHGRIKVARYLDLNDPFELMASELSDKEIRRAVGVLKSQFNKNRGLLCFSKIWYNPVLWSHYADKHKGIALGFDIDDDFVAPIKYRASRLPVKFKQSNKRGGLESKFVHELLHTKYKHWEYENEIRLHVDLNKSDIEDGIHFTSFEDVGLELKEIILGHSCKESLKNTRKLANSNYKGIHTFKARLAFRKYEVVPNRRTL